MLKILTVIPLVIALFMVQGCGSGSSPQQPQTPVAAPLPKYTNWSTVVRKDIGDSSVATLSVAVVGDYIYQTDNYNGLNMLNVADLGNVKVHQKSINAEISDGAGHSSYDEIYKVAVKGNIAIIAVNPGCIGWCTQDRAEVRLYDITDRAASQYLATVPVPLSPEDILVDGSYLYITGNSRLTSDSELNIIDISNPGQPKKVGAVAINGPGKMARQGSEIIISQMIGDSGDVDNYKNIQVIDVSNPSVPVLTGAPTTSVSYSFRYSPLVVAGTVAYVSDWINGLYAVDLADHFNSVIIATLSQTDNIYAITSYGSYLYVAAGTAGLKIYNIEQPKQPVLVKTIETKTAIRFVAVTNGRGVYITDAPAAPNNPAFTGQQLNIFYLE